MRHVIRKLFFDFEKEELFLNKMSANGLALSKYTWGKYVFYEAPKGEYIYRLELLDTQWIQLKVKILYNSWKKQVQN